MLEDPSLYCVSEEYGKVVVKFLFDSFDIIYDESVDFNKIMSEKIQEEVTKETVTEYDEFDIEMEEADEDNI